LIDSPVSAGNECPAEILLFGYGNPSRGDDALGPLLLERLDPLLTEAVRRQAGGIECLTDFQLQVENALDLQGRRLVLFVDTHLACPPPWRLTRLQAAADIGYSTHAISPASVLRVYREIVDAAPPPCFLLGIRGERFELGEALTPEAESSLDAAVTLVTDLCAHPATEYWLGRCHED
jgi:hydrogenase maturation protease